jgi:VIT1/CCC1 family predicted Fe2+/Mn2+ transporter
LGIIIGLLGKTDTIKRNTELKIQTYTISINQKLQDSLIENWNSTEQPNEDPNILDSGIVLPNKSLKVTLRIPWQLSGGYGHMLINANLLFVTKQNRMELAILCHFTKPMIFSIILGFLTSLIFIFPYFIFPKINWLPFILAGIAISGIYFGWFYVKIRRMSILYLIELRDKYMY